MHPSLDRQPHVVMVSGSAPPIIDGVGDCTAELLGALARLRPEWRWTWLSRRPRWFHRPFLASRQGYNLVRPAHTWIGPSQRLTLGTLRWLRPSILHIQDQTHSYFESDAAVRLARSVSCPVVTTLHEYHTELASVEHTTELVQRSSRIIANDRRNAERSRLVAGREPDAIWWSGNTVPPPEPAWNISTRPGLVATFGFLNALKSLGLVFDAISTLREEGLTAIGWRVIGPFDPSTNSSHAELERTMDRDWVEFTGAARATDRSLRTWLAEAQVMALPFADGASMRRTTLHAAWALGIPVVTTPPPFDEPAIVDGVNCVLVRETTPEAWAAALRLVLTQPELAERLRLGGLESARKYGWPELARRHLELYDDLLSLDHGRRGS